MTLTALQFVQLLARSPRLASSSSDKGKHSRTGAEDRSASIKTAGVDVSDDICRNIKASSVPISHTAVAHRHEKNMFSKEEFVTTLRQLRASWNYRISYLFRIGIRSMVSDHWNQSRYFARSPLEVPEKLRGSQCPQAFDRKGWDNSVAELYDVHAASQYASDRSQWHYPRTTPSRWSSSASHKKGPNQLGTFSGSSG